LVTIQLLTAVIDTADYISESLTGCIERRWAKRMLSVSEMG